MAATICPFDVRQLLVHRQDDNRHRGRLHPQALDQFQPGAFFERQVDHRDLRWIGRHGAQCGDGILRHQAKPLIVAGDDDVDRRRLAVAEGMADRFLGDAKKLRAFGGGHPARPPRWITRQGTPR